MWSLFPDQDCELVYTADPWDNLLEVYNRSYVRFFANQERTDLTALCWPSESGRSTQLTETTGRINNRMWQYYTVP